MLPNDEFFGRVRYSLQALGASAGKIFSQSDDPERSGFEPRLRESAARNGFTLTNYQVTPAGVIWTIELDGDSPATSAGDAR